MEVKEEWSKGEKGTVERQCLLGEILKRFLYTESNGVGKQKLGAEVKKSISGYNIGNY